MNQLEGKLVHTFFYQDRDEQGWSIGKKAHKRVVWDEETREQQRYARQYREKFKPERKVSVAYDGPVLTFIGSRVATLIPAEKRENSSVRDILFFTFVKRSRDELLARDEGSSQTVELCTGIESSAPSNEVTRIGIPDEIPELKSHSEEDVRSFLAECWSILFSVFSSYTKAKSWTRATTVGRWVKLHTYAATFINNFHELVTQEQQDQVKEAYSAFSQYYTGKKVGGYVCDGYVRYKHMSEAYSKVRAAKNRLKACMNAEEVYHSACIDYDDPQSECDVRGIALVNEFAAELKEFLGDDSALGIAFIDAHCAPCYGWSYMLSHQHLLCMIMRHILGYDHEPDQHFRRKLTPAELVRRELDLAQSSVVIPDFGNDGYTGKLKGFITERNATLPADMWDSLKALAYLAHEHPDRIEHRHIGPYTCHGWDSHGYLIVGCHRFSKTAVEFFYDLLKNGEEYARTRIKDILLEAAKRNASHAKVVSSDCMELVEKGKVLFTRLCRITAGDRVDKAKADLEAEENRYKAIAAALNMHKG